MKTTITRTPSGNGAFVVIEEDEEERATRLRQRQERIRSEMAKAALTPGQIDAIVSR